MSHTKFVAVSNQASAAIAASAPTASTIAILENDTLTASGDLTAISSGAAKTYQVLSAAGNSIRFKGSDVVSATRAAYSAGTAQVIQVHVFVESDGSAEIKLINVTDGREKFAIATFESTGNAAGQAGAETAATAIAAAINASKRDVFKDVTAAVDGSDANQVNITMPINVVMRFACNDASDGAITTNAALSIGEEGDVNADVEDALPFVGVTNISGPNVVKPTVATAGTNYDKFCIFVKQTVGDREDIHEIVIYQNVANAQGDTDLTAFVG
jgi:hypothetical protein